MKDHNCPKLVREYRDYYRDGYMDAIHPHIPCWVCEASTRNRYASMVPMLPSLYAWLEGHEPEGVHEFLYDLFYMDMPYGTMKARDGDPYEWLSDNVDRVEDLIADIEAHCIEERAA